MKQGIALRKLGWLLLGSLLLATAGEAQERKVTARLLADYRPGEGEWKKLPRKRRSTATPTNAA